jgi:hypothetical protein
MVEAGDRAAQGGRRPSSAGRQETEQRREAGCRAAQRGRRPSNAEGILDFNWRN